MSAITAILDSIAETPISVPEVDESKLSIAERIELKSDSGKAEAAFEWKMRGVPIANIAKMFEVDPRTIYRWLQKHTEEFRKQLEQQPRANIVSESLLFLNRLKEICMYEITQIERGGDVELDIASGDIRRDPSNNPTLKIKWLEAALKCQRMGDRLMLDTGVLERAPEKMYHTLTGKRVLGDEDEKTDERSNEEIMESVEKLLAHGRRL